MRRPDKAQTAAIAGSYGEAEPGHGQCLRTVRAWHRAGPVARRGLQGLQRRMGGAGTEFKQEN